MIQSYFSRTYFLLYSETQLTLYRVRGQKVIEKANFVLSEFDSLAAALARVRQRYPLKTEDTLIVGLPLRLFSLVSFSLPRAAEETLDEAIGYELTRHVPYELESCLFHTTSVLQGDSLQVCAVLALKDQLQSYLAALSASGLSVTAIAPALFLTAWMTHIDGIYAHCPEPFAEFLVYRDGKVTFSTTVEMTDNSEQKYGLAAALALLQNYGDETNQIRLWNVNEGTKKLLSAWIPSPDSVNIDIDAGEDLPPRKGLPYKIDLVSASMRRKKKLKTWLKVAAGFLFVLSLGLYPVAFIAGKYTALNVLEEKLAVVRDRAQTLDSLRQENQTMIDQYGNLAAYVRSRPQAVDTLKEITDILSSEVWLISLEIHDRRLKLRGTATEATTVIEALTASPLFEDVHFDSPVVKRGSRETFTIVANLK